LTEKSRRSKSAYSFPGKRPSLAFEHGEAAAILRRDQSFPVVEIAEPSLAWEHQCLLACLSGRVF